MEDKIREVMATHLGIAKQDIDFNDSFEEDLGLGRIAKVDLFNEMAKQFNISFAPGDIDEIGTIADLVAYVEDAMLEQA